jgi:hypothetical protein
MQAIEKTPPSVSASKIVPTASAEATAEVNTSAEAASATEAANLEATLSRIDKLILGMPIGEASAAAEEGHGPSARQRERNCRSCFKRKRFRSSELSRTRTI